MKKRDIGYELTEEELSKLEHKISDVFSEAEKDIEEEANAYFEKYEKRQQEMLKKLSAGEITESYYQDWCYANICRGKRWEAMRDTLAERATQANEVAMQYVNEAMPEIYAINHSYAAYCLDQVGVLDNGIYMEGNWAVLDESTVRRLLVEEPNLMPNYSAAKAIDRGIDLAYGKRKITECVTSSIIRGQSVHKTAYELKKSIPGMNEVSALRAARTATTSAQNGGRQDMLDVATNQMGVKCNKMWISIIDERTRESHIELNKVVVGPSEKFPNKLMYPGDRRGKPEEVYNCRCALGYLIPEMAEDFSEGGIFYSGKSVATYKKWLEEKKAAKNGRS